jgi:prepilin-type N-terminal cleavage/methylation domain-containing protein
MMKVLKRLERRRGDEGFSLVEVVISMMLLAMLAMAAYPLLFNSVQALAFNNITTAATITVQNQIETLRATPTCANLISAVGTDTYLDARGQAYKVSVALPSSCAEATAVGVNFTAVQSSNNRVIIKQQLTQIFIPPASGSTVVQK